MSMAQRGCQREHAHEMESSNKRRFLLMGIQRGLEYGFLRYESGAKLVAAISRNKTACLGFGEDEVEVLNDRY
jgi:hypothetical protein